MTDGWGLFRKLGKVKAAVLFTGFFLLGSVFFPSELWCQDSILNAYQQNFIRCSLDAKPGILLDAATDEQAAGFIGPLYDYALYFVLYNAELLGEDPDMIYLAIIAARGVGVVDYRYSTDTLLKVFQKYRDSAVRVEIINSLAAVGKGNSLVYETLNQYLLEQNKLRFSSLSIDYPVISACIAALAGFGDSSSYLPIFGAMTADYSSSITREAAAALDTLPGNFWQFLMDLVLNNPPPEKLAAFMAGANNQRFTPVEQGQLAYNAMTLGLDYQAVSIEETNILSSLRYLAAIELTRLQWTQASHLAIQHFYRVQSDFQRGYATKERYLESIQCLGAMGTSEAAINAALQLGLINSQTEYSGAYDTDIILALIRVLGTIGEKSAFDPLMAIDYLPYSYEIKAAAREAVDRPRW